MYISDFTHAHKNYSFGPKINTQRPWPPGAFPHSYKPGQMCGYHTGNSQWDPLWSYKPSLGKIVITESLTVIACFCLSAEISAPKELSAGQTNARWSSEKAAPTTAAVFLFSTLILSCHKMRISNWPTELLRDKLESLLSKSLCFSLTSLSRSKKACLKARLFSNLLQFLHVSLAGLRNALPAPRAHVVYNSELQLVFAK